jgi:hypothetical protein
LNQRPIFDRFSVAARTQKQCVRKSTNSINVKYTITLQERNCHTHVSTHFFSYRYVAHAACAAIARAIMRCAARACACAAARALRASSSRGVRAAPTRCTSAQLRHRAASHSARTYSIYAFFSDPRSGRDAARRRRRRGVAHASTQHARACAACARAMHARRRALVAVIRHSTRASRRHRGDSDAHIGGVDGVGAIAITSAA